MHGPEARAKQLSHRRLGPGAALAFAKGGREGHVSDRRVEPDVQNFSLGIGVVQRYRDAPVQVTGHGAFRQSALDLSQREVQHACVPPLEGEHHPARLAITRADQAPGGERDQRLRDEQRGEQRDAYREPQLAENQVHLVALGEEDRQVDPFQGLEAFQEALQKTETQYSHVELFPNADHNIVISETGCLDERDNRSKSAWLNYAPGYLDLMEEWLVQLNNPTTDPVESLPALQPLTIEKASEVQLLQPPENS